MKEVKRYRSNGSVYTFETKGEDYEIETKYGHMWLATCLENGREAWLDSHGIQFIGESRFEAEEFFLDNCVPYGFTVWGGELRDSLPHGARYYMKRGIKK